MEINKTIRVSDIDKKQIQEYADEFSKIVDAMEPNDYIETKLHYWDYEEIAKLAEILDDFANNDILVIVKGE